MDSLLSDLAKRTLAAIQQRRLAQADSPVLLMVSGGSDSTALAYVAAELRDAGELGPVAMLHVNHCLRGADSDGDEAFVTQLAQLLEIPLFSCRIDIAAMMRETGENMEALARRERYVAADEALESVCFHEGFPKADGRIFTAHTADDRVESFYMRSIVGTGPGGFRAMRHRNGPVVRPLLGASRQELRDYLQLLADAGVAVARDGDGKLWREDATNDHTDRFRAYVRHEIVPRAKERNPKLLEVLSRTMDLIADEDDMLEQMTSDIVSADAGSLGEDASDGFLLKPHFGSHPAPLQRRVCMRLLSRVLGCDARVETATIEAVLVAFDPESGAPRSGYVTNVQGDYAVSANKRGVRVEPMAAFRARRKRA